MSKKNWKDSMFNHLRHTTYVFSFILSLLFFSNAYSATEAELKQKVVNQPTNAEAYNELALFYFNQKKDTLALENWEKSLTLNPKAPGKIHYYMSLSYRDAKQYDKATNHLKEAIGLEPSNASYHNALGNIYYETKNDLEALEAYKKALLFDSKQEVYHTNLGGAYLILKNYPEAIKSYQNALTINPKSKISYYKIGYTYQVQKLNDIAVENFKKALEIDPNHFDSLYQIGIAYYDLAKYADAENSFRKALQINSDPSQNLHYWLGISLVYQSDKNKILQGIEYLKQAVAFKPDSPGNYDLGYAYWKIGGAKENFQAAIDALLKSMKVKHNNAFANYYLGSSYLQTGNRNMAVDHLKKAISLHTKFYAAYAELGIALSDLGQYNEALTTYQQALANKPEKFTYSDEVYNPLDMLYHNMAVAYKNLNQNTECITYSDKAIALYDKYYGHYMTKGICLFNQGKNDAALTEYKQAMTLKADVPLLHFNLGLVYLSKNDKASAQKHYEYLLEADPDGYAKTLKEKIDNQTAKSL